MTTDGVLTNSDELQAGIDEAFVQGVIEGVAMPATLIETQLNRVFLCHDRAYKLKRAVRLPSLIGWLRQAPVLSLWIASFSRVTLLFAVRIVRVDPAARMCRTDVESLAFGRA